MYITLIKYIKIYLSVNLHNTLRNIKVTKKEIVKQLDNSGIGQLLNLIKEIPGANICYKNTEGTILWHNTAMVKNLKVPKKDIQGKLVSDLISAESAELCLQYDLQVINSKKTTFTNINIQLINGDHQEYFATTTPVIVSSGNVEGIIVNAVNTKQNICQEFIIYRNSDQPNYLLNNKLQELYFNLKHPLEEILFLANIMTSGKVNQHVNSLCSELKNFAKKLLHQCNNILRDEKISNSQQVPVVLKKINLRELIPSIFNKLSNQFISNNTKLFLIVSNKIPEIIVSDLFRVNTILTFVGKILLNSSINWIKINPKILCTVRLLKKFNDRNIFISLFFEIKDCLAKEFVFNQEQIQLANSLAKELNGNIYCINDGSNLQIIFNFSAGVCST